MPLRSKQIVMNCDVNKMKILTWHPLKRHLACLWFLWKSQLVMGSLMGEPRSQLSGNTSCATVSKRELFNLFAPLNDELQLHMPKSLQQCNVRWLLRKWMTLTYIFKVSKSSLLSGVWQISPVFHRVLKSI